MNNHLWDQFGEALRRYRGDRLRRMIKSPGPLLYSKALELASRWRQKPVWRTARTFWGDPMNVVFPEPVSMTIYRYHFFEEELTHIFLEKLQPGMVFFDVGSHFGYFSLLASAIVGESGQVHAFEPTRSTYEVLCSNTAGKTNMHAHNLAMWSGEATLHFADYGVEFSAFNSICDNSVRGNLPKAVKPMEYDVRATSIDAQVKASGIAPNFIKMDAEGAERVILEGMSETIRKYGPAVTVEVGDRDHESGSKSRLLLDGFVERRYQPYEWVDGKILPHELKDRYRYTNILLLPR